MQNEQPQPFGQFLKAYFKNLWQMIKHPWAFIPTLLLSAAWIVLGIAQTRMAASPAFDWANFFTFTQGGLFGGLAGAIGGIVGKILIATLLNALIMPLFMKGSRPFAKFGRGIGGFFKSFAFNSLSAMSWFLMGISLALMIYSVMNITQRWQEGLVGVAGAILLIKSIGQRGGMLFSLLFSFAKGFTRRGRVPSYVGIMRFLSGMAVGFTAGTVLNAFGLRWAVFIAACAFAIAILFIWFGKRQRAALTTVAIAALLMVPVYADSPSCLVSPVQQSQDALKAAGKKHAKELQPYVDEINRCIAVVQSQNENTPQAEQDEAQRQLEAAQKNYHDALVAFARRDGGQAAEMPQEMKELYDKANDQSISGKVERLQQLAAEAEARGDHAAADRYANQIAEIYMGQANAAMDLYKLAQQYQEMGGVTPAGEVETDGHSPFGDPDGGDYGDSGDGDNADDPASADPNPFGKGPGADINDWKPSLDDDFWNKVGLDAETGEEIERVATEGWADESSQVEDEDDVTMWEGIGAGAAAATAAGAAAGAAGGAGGGAGGAGGAGGGLPDLPDGDWEATEPEERDEEEDEDEEEDNTEGGDGGDGDEDKNKDPFKNNPYVTRNPDGSITMTSPSTGEKIDLEPDGNGGWTNLRSGVEYDNNDVNEWVRSQDENGDHWKNQQATNQQYQEAFEKDAAEFSSRSEEERINKEVAEDKAAAEKQEMHDKIIQKAEEYHVKTTDAKGNERDINDIREDTKKEIKRDVYWDNYKNELSIQQTCSEVELECSEKVATYTMVDTVAEGTVNTLAEYVPGGDKVKDFHTFTKATMVGGMEGYLKEGWKGAGKGAATGAAEGLVGVAQNHLSDLTKGATGNETVDTLAADVLNVQMEGVKVAIHDFSRGKSVEETYQDMQEATINKTGNILIGKVLNIKDEHDANAVGELIQKAHDNLKWGGGNNPEENDKTISGHLAEGWQNFKDKTAEKMCDLYYGN